ncbi:unnamed protein product [Amoebophrya sp. A120]|nr:unnamed protein product [Amoebophrya sp. A120]|eukprot:GSA120T00012001001.1
MAAQFGPPLVLRGKVAILGKSKVGKTAFREVLGDGSFPRSYNVTLGRENTVKVVPFPDRNIQVELHLQECGGNIAGATDTQTNTVAHSQTVDSVCKGTSCFVLMYDVSDPDSLRELHQFLPSIDKAVEGQIPCCICLVANKNDSSTCRRVSEEDQSDFMRNRPDLQLIPFGISAMDNSGLADVCDHLALHIAQTYEQRLGELRSYVEQSYAY